jgi:hypothetical protein
MKNYIIKVTSNEAKRHFTLWTSTGNKYRTIPMSKEEFQSCKHNTYNDWKQYLKSDEYYSI